MGEEVWQKGPKDGQGTIAKSSWEMGDLARSEGERLDKELMAKLAPPMTANEVDKEAFIKASAAIYEEFGAQVPGGAELIKLFQSLR